MSVPFSDGQEEEWVICVGDEVESVHGWYLGRVVGLQRYPSVIIEDRDGRIVTYAAYFVKPRAARHGKTTRTETKDGGALPVGGAQRTEDAP